MQYIVLLCRLDESLVISKSNSGNLKNDDRTTSADSTSIELRQQVITEDYQPPKSPNPNPSFIKTMEYSKFSSLAKTQDESSGRWVWLEILMKLIIVRRAVTTCNFMMKLGANLIWKFIGNKLTVGKWDNNVTNFQLRLMFNNITKLHAFNVYEAKPNLKKKNNLFNIRQLLISKI